jgi:hypothetical protein
MGKRAAEIRWSTTKTAEILLAEAGYDEDNPPPEYAKIMASQAIKSHSAMRDWRQFIGAGEVGTSNTFETLGHYLQPPPGERCPRCGYWNLMGVYHQDELMQNLKLLRYAIENDIPYEDFTNALESVVEKHKENPPFLEHKNTGNHT